MNPTAHDLAVDALCPPGRWNDPEARDAAERWLRSQIANAPTPPTRFDRITKEDETP